MTANTTFVTVGAIQQDGEWIACDSATVRRQIDEVKKLKMPTNVRFTDDTDPTQPFTIEKCIGNGLRHVVRDRELRIDQGIPMADRPPLVVVTRMDNTCVQIDYYAGHDFLTNDQHLGGGKFDTPDFSDPPTAGIRLLGMGIVEWRGNFQIQYYCNGECGPAVRGSKRQLKKQEKVLQRLSQHLSDILSQ